MSAPLVFALSAIAICSNHEVYATDDVEYTGGNRDGTGCTQMLQDHEQEHERTLLGMRSALNDALIRLAQVENLLAQCQASFQLFSTNKAQSNHGNHSSPAEFAAESVSETASLTHRTGSGRVLLEEATETPAEGAIVLSETVPENATEAVVGEAAAGEAAAGEAAAGEAAAGEAELLFCSTQEVAEVVNMALGNDVRLEGHVIDMLGKNPGCATCIIQCSVVPNKFDQLWCLNACLHQRENYCDARVPLLGGRNPVLDRNAILAMVESSVPDCAFCILETVASVCGEQCVQLHLHINTDYPIFAKPCFPKLADALVSAQASTLREVLSTGALFGLTASASMGANDLFLPTSESFQGAMVYQSLHAGESLYRCQPGDPSAEIWALSSENDRVAWSRCEGRLWIDIEAAHVRSSFTARSAVASGLYVGMGLRSCEQFLSKETKESVLVMSADDGTQTIPLCTSRVVPGCVLHTSLEARAFHAINSPKVALPSPGACRADRALRRLGCARRPVCHPRD